MNAKRLSFAKNETYICTDSIMDNTEYSWSRNAIFFEMCTAEEAPVVVDIY